MSEAANCDFIAEPGNPLCLLPFPDDYYTVSDPASRDWPPRRPQHRRHAGQCLRYPDRRRLRITPPTASAPARRSCSRSPASTPPPTSGDRRGADQPHRPLPPGQRADRRDRRHDRQALADLGRDRLDRGGPGESAAGDPPGGQLRLRPPLHRRPARPPQRRRADARSARRPSATTATSVPSKQPQINARRGHFEAIFSRLQRSGHPAHDLYLAWDFTVASDQNNAGRELAMRDAAFAQLGDTNLADGVPQGASPSFQVTSVEDGARTRARSRAGSRAASKCPATCSRAARRAGRFQLDAGGLPDPERHLDRQLRLHRPARRWSTGPPARRRGRRSTARALRQRLARSFDADTSAASPRNTGSSSARPTRSACRTADLPHRRSASLQDLSTFPQIADRLQQGLLDELFLGRADGQLRAASPPTPAFHAGRHARSAARCSTPADLYYNGNSQGGIMGGALTAVSPDFTRASLGRAGDELLGAAAALGRLRRVRRRSSIPPTRTSWRARWSSTLIQMLWDRGEPNGYAHRMTTNPLPNTPPHQVLMNVAFGDHQVTIFQADVEARTIGAATRTADPLSGGRWPDTDVLWNVPAIRRYPVHRLGDRSTGTPARSATTRPARRPDRVPNRRRSRTCRTGSGEDPHGAPRGQRCRAALVSDFFNGAILGSDNCGGGPCYAGSFTGP